MLSFKVSTFFNISYYNSSLLALLTIIDYNLEIFSISLTPIWSSGSLRYLIKNWDKTSEYSWSKDPTCSWNISLIMSKRSMLWLVSGKPCTYFDRNCSSDLQNNSSTFPITISDSAIVTIEDRLLCRSISRLSMFSNRDVWNYLLNRVRWGLNIFKNSIRYRSIFWLKNIFAIFSNWGATIFIVF